jgi:hypothetical protein
MSDLMTVQFYGKSLLLVEHNGEPFAPMKPIVDGMGMDWKAQHEKLKSSRFKSTVVEIPIVAADGKLRDMICLPLRKLPGWLMTVHPGKVREEIREKIVMYQNECDDVLWAYWTKGKAEQADDSEPSSVLERTPLYLDAAQTVIRHRIWFPAVYRAINEFAGSEAFRHMTKQQVRAAKPFARRIANGTATPQDWQILESQRKALGHDRIQPELDGFGPPALK